MSFKNILITENDASTRKLMGVLLNRAGHVVTAVDSGSEGIALLRKQAFDLVIVDLMMPGVSGQDVIAHINEHSPDTPVIVCTAAGPTITNELATGVVRMVIRKPFNIMELTDAVNEHSRPFREPAVTVLIVDDDERARYIMRTMVDPANVVEAESAEVALRAVQAQRPDAVMLDLTLPGMPGEDFLRTLKDEPATAEIPVVIVTSRRDAEVETNPALTRADGYIYKGDLSREKIATVLQVVLKARSK